ncbi:LOW QUALITY PROTEIN: purine nucleoside phosphorylase [Ara ararauna]
MAPPRPLIGPPPSPNGSVGGGVLRPTHGGGGVPRTRSYEACAEAAAWVRARLKAPPPVVGLVCGSGLGGLARELQQTQSFDYGDIPHFPRSTVQGHAGRLLVGTLGGCPCAVLQGRFHLYEGYSPAQVALPVRTLALLGAHTVVLTNAAGSLRAGLEPGQLLVIRDHIDLPGLAGRSPLAGANDPRFGPRFPVMAGAYDAALRRLALALAPAPLRARSGVYCGVGGPSYETPAECALLRRLGGDAVGMSTVAEAAAARHCGLRVLGLSLITNAAPGGDEDEEEHAKETEEHARHGRTREGHGRTREGHGPRGGAGGGAGRGPAPGGAAAGAGAAPATRLGHAKDTLRGG